MKYHARDWIADRRHENGQYQCKCYACGETFIGHKRRVECRVCKARPRDFFKQIIEVGDWYFASNPPALGRVIKVRKSSLMMEIGADYLGRNQTRGVKSPDQGICLDKIPEQG